MKFLELNLIKLDLIKLDLIIILLLSYYIVYIPRRWISSLRFYSLYSLFVFH